MDSRQSRMCCKLITIHHETILIAKSSLKEYETVFRDHFHFRKNLDQKDWEYIAYRIEKRRSEGKSSVVHLDDKLISHKRVQRGTRKYSSNGKQKLKTSMYLLYNPPERRLLISTCVQTDLSS